VPVTREVLVPLGGDFAKLTTGLKPPFAVKIVSRDIAHKTEAGGVRLKVAATDLATVAAEIVASSKRYKPGAVIDGVLVSEMVIGGVETVVGVSQDELFGPTVMVGLGGVLVEIFEDVAIRVPPFGKDEAKRMVTGLKGLPLLQGARGAKKADINALVDVIMKVQRLAVDHSDTTSDLDINPLVVLPKGAKALDALIVTR
jgi:acyl-CoA synthetase (NDP forming)